MFDVAETLPKFRQFGFHAVEDAIHIGRVHDGAIEVSGEELDAERQADFGDTLQTLEIPGGVVAAQLDLQRLQAVGLDPFVQRGRISVGDLVRAGFGEREVIEAADEMPSEELGRHR